MQGTSSKRKAYEEKLNAQLKEWSAEIDLFKAKIKNDGADAKLNYYKTIDDFEHNQNKAKMKLMELKTTGDDAWEAVKTGAEAVWAETKTAYHKVASNFK